MVNIKVELVKRKAKLVDVVDKLSKKKQQRVPYYSLSRRLTSNTLRLQEAEEILDVLGCRLLVVDKDDEIFLTKEA